MGPRVPSQFCDSFFTSSFLSAMVYCCGLCLCGFSAKAPKKQSSTMLVCKTVYNNTSTLKSVDIIGYPKFRFKSNLIFCLIFYFLHIFSRILLCALTIYFSIYTFQVICPMKVVHCSFGFVCKKRFAAFVESPRILGYLLWYVKIWGYGALRCRLERYLSSARNKEKL